VGYVTALTFADLRSQNKVTGGQCVLHVGTKPGKNNKSLYTLDFIPHIMGEPGEKKARQEVKNIKVSPECKRLLGLEKRDDERYEDMFLRLLGGNEEEAMGEKAEEGDKQNIPFDVKQIGKQAESFLGEFGLKAKDLYDLIRDNQNIERMKLRRIQGKPLDLTKTAKTIIWAIVTIIALMLTLPVTSELMRWIIR